MIALVVRFVFICVFFVVVLIVLSCGFLAQLYVPAGEPVLGGIAPDARLVVTAQHAPVYAKPDGAARVVGSLSANTQIRATGPDTAEWVRVRSIDPVIAGWVRRADVQEVHP